MTVIEPLEPLWRPARDAPLFPGELLGGPDELTSLDAHTRSRIQAYLAAVVTARRFPLHINIVWNALHYGYDLSRGGYHEGLLRVDAFTTLDPGSAATLPTGAMVTLPTATPLWTEIVHTEYDDTSFDFDGDLPGARSGAPLDDDVTLRVVIDPAAFGPLVPEQHNTLTRLTRRGTLDALGHLLGQAGQHPETSDGTSTPTRYATWLTADPARLGGGPVPAALGSTDQDTLAIAVEASLQALLALLADTPGLVVCGEYVTTAEHPSVLDPADIADIAAHISRTRWQAVRYTGAGPAVRALATDRDLHGVRYLTALTELTAALRPYALTDVATAPRVHLRLDDVARGGGVWRASDGAVANASAIGVSPLVPLGLGYAGRALPSPPEAPNNTNGAVKLESIGSGSSGCAPVHNEGNSVFRSPEDRCDQRPDDISPGKARSDDGIEHETLDDKWAGNGLLGDLDITASHVTFTVALRVRHLADGVLPLPPAVAGRLAAVPGPLAVRLGHPGVDLDDDETFHEPVALAPTNPHRLIGITYPLTFYPGLLLTATITVGGRILDLTTEALPNPVSFSGSLLTHATDIAILAAFCGRPLPPNDQQRAAAGQHAPDVPGPHETGLDGDAATDPGSSADTTDVDDPRLDSRCGTGGPVSDDKYGDADLADVGNRAYLALLIRTLLRSTLPDRDGTRIFSAPALVATAFAGLPLPSDAVGRAHRLLDAHAARGRLLRLPGPRRFVSISKGFVEDPPRYLWWSPGCAAPLRQPPALRPAPVQRPHWVPVSLRKLPPGWSPSTEKLAAWPTVRASLGEAYLPLQLPPGYTWVEAHERGADPGWRSGAVRDR